MVDGNDFVVCERSPGTNGSKPDENRQIEQHIYRRLERIIQRLKSKPVVPGKYIARNEASQHVVTPNHAACPDDEESQRNGEHQEALSVDELLLFGPVEELFAIQPIVAPYTTLRRIVYPHVSPNQSLIASDAPPLCPAPPSPVYLMRYSATKRNGYPSPSLAPDSAIIIFCKSFGTFLSANLPLTMLFERTGSVGVTHAPIASACTNGRFGTSPQTRRLLASHMKVMIGPSMRARDFHSICRYRLGSCTPARTN